MRITLLGALTATWLILCLPISLSAVDGGNAGQPGSGSELQAMLDQVRQKAQAAKADLDRQEKQLADLRNDLKAYHEITNSASGKDMANQAWDAVLKKWGVAVGSIRRDDVEALEAKVVPAIAAVYNPEWDKGQSIERLTPLDRENRSEGFRKWLRESPNPALVAKSLDELTAMRRLVDDMPQPTPISRKHSFWGAVELPWEYLAFVLPGVLVLSMVLFIRHKRGSGSSSSP